MKYKNLALTLGFAVTSTFILLVSCKKINDYTQLGGDLIPDVDNINTFDTILDIQAFNDTFTKLNDTIYTDAATTHFLGHIDNDPLFGKTDARLSLELKPGSYRYSFSGRPDSLHIDSVVLVLSYVETYGDTNAVQQVNVYEVGNEFKRDTSYNVREYKQTRLGMLGSTSFRPRDLNDSVKVFQDTTVNQLRIRLDDAFGARLLDYDTSTAGGRIAAYVTDSTFQSYFKGFTLESTGGNALVGINLQGDNTKLAIYYKDDNGDAGSTPTANWDTTVAYWSFAGNTNSAFAQNITRDYNGTQLAALSDGTTGTADNELFIQSSPGSYATLKIPGLTGLTNRVVHRAEVIVDQVWTDISDSLFYPTYMYLDAYGAAGSSSFFTIPYDVTFDANGTANLSALGVSPYGIAGPSGFPVKEWRFNVTRYVQNIANGNITPSDLRLTMPYYITEDYKSNPAATPFPTTIYVNGAPGKGRVKLVGTDNGALPGANPQRIRMRIVYSKI